MKISICNGQTLIKKKVIFGWT